MKYKKRLLGFVISLFGPACLFASSDPHLLVYHFNYLNTVKIPTLSVRFEFKGNKKGETMIKLPTFISGNKELYKNIRNIQAKEVEISATKKPDEYLIKYKPLKNIILTYEVVEAQSDKPKLPRQFRAPIFQDDYFQFKGAGVFVYPKDYKKEKTVNITLDWNTPEQWPIANSYGVMQYHQEISSSVTNLLNSLFLAGAYRLHKAEFQQQAIWTAIHKDWLFSDENFNEIAVKIIAAERAFWNITVFPSFLISVLPVSEGCKSTGGFGLYNAFAIFIGSECKLNKRLFLLLAHEHFHTWNKPAIFLDAEQNPVKYYWFSEGFTEYYARLISLRLKLITLKEYIHDYNDDLKAYYSSPFNRLTIEFVKEKYYSEKKVHKLPYLQGDILAHNWNAQIKQTTKGKKSLDDLIKTLINAKNPRNSNLNLSTLQLRAKPFINKDVIPDIDKIYAGELVEPNPNSLGPCATLILKPVPHFILNTEMYKADPNNCLAWFIK